MAAAAFLSLFGLFGLAQGDTFLKKGFQVDLVEELQRYTSAAAPADLARFEATLSPMYSSLPKDDGGLLEFDLVRYALHRMIVQKHGWYVKGLQPDGKQWNASSLGSAVKNWMDISVSASVQDWVPAHIENAVHARVGSAGGLSLRELSALASLLETVARKEAASRLDEVYNLFGFNASEPLTGLESKQVLDTFMYIYLDPVNFYPKTGEEAWDRIRRFQNRHDSEWPAINTWLRDLQRNVSGTVEYGTLEHASAMRVVEEVGEQYFHFDVRECTNLKAALMDMEGSQTGRVPLKTFYKKGMTRDSLFRFDEKQAYLRDLGSLDESDPANPSVIIPNYVMSAPQCLQASKLYAVCCRNECEDLLTQLEARVGESTAVPENVIEVVQALTSETVRAPRELPASMLEKLRQVAEVNGGRVPLHGRLFAQWMHHAFPRECPFPHETGTTNPMAPEDWLRETGHESTGATEEEMVCHVSGPCSGGASSGDDATMAAPPSDAAVSPSSGSSAATELPWTLKEELLTRRSLAKAGKFCLRTVAQLGALLGMVGVLLASVFNTLHAAAMATAEKGGADSLGGKKLAKKEAAEALCWESAAAFI